MSDPVWEYDRACIGTPLSVWYAPEAGGRRYGNMSTYYNEARRICAGCPCLAECEARMFATGQVRNGFAAGMTAVDRQHHPRWTGRERRFVNGSILKRASA